MYTYMPIEKTPRKLHIKTVSKGWGSEKWIVNKPEYCLKILNFLPEAELSFHFHVLKDEAWYVTNGDLYLHYFDLKTGQRKQMYLTVGDVINIPQYVPHKLVARNSGATILEVSTQHFEEDSYRIGEGDSQK